MDALIVSAGLDTNGQNARYVRASERWGTDEGVLKALALGKYDPASVVGRFQVAAEKFGELRIRSAHKATHAYQQMPADIIWDRRTEAEIRDLALDADVIHLNNSYAAWTQLRVRSSDLRRIDKPMLLHHHGSLLRTGVEKALNRPKGGTPELVRWARAKGAIQAVSTVDLMRYAPDELHWLPTAYDIDWLAEFGAEHRGDHGDVLRIVSCPTNRALKSTSHLEQAVRNLKRDGLKVDLVLAEGLPWIEALKVKATADIYFDQVLLGYGCNAIEAWGMGIPVIAGADEWTLAQMHRVYGTSTLPFYTATEDTIGEAIRDLSDPTDRAAWALRGLTHVRKFHDERPALTRLAELYGMALAAPAPSVLVPDYLPVTFRSRVPQITIGARRITFVDGLYTTTNPHLATRLREMATRPMYGIEEVDAA